MVPVIVRAGLITVALMSFGIAPAFATQVLRTSLEQMTHGSEVIIHARVVSQKVTLSDDGARILTLTTLEVLNTLKGKGVPQEVVIYQVGGELNGQVLRIPGALSFELEEEMVFFAARFKNMLVSYGMGLGKYQVKRGGGKISVTPQFGDVSFVARDAGGHLQHAAAPSTEALNLGVFLTRVNTILKGGQR
jgi:hypothetical protein